MAADRRWIILAQDGRHVTAGRAALGLAGWLATLDGNCWSRRRVALAPVQILGDGATPDWPAAITAFEAARQCALRSL